MINLSLRVLSNLLDKKRRFRAALAHTSAFGVGSLMKETRLVPSSKCICVTGEPL
jgi:hypothetical protein